MRRGRAKLGVHLHVAARRRSARRRRRGRARRCSRPSRPRRQRRGIDVLGRRPVDIEQPHAGRGRARSARSFRRPRGPGCRRGQRGADCRGDVSSSLIRMRGAASKRVTREPNALKIDATCTPVAPAPITSSDGGHREAPGVAVGTVNSKPGSGSRRDVATGADDDLSGPQPRRVLAFDRVRVDEPRGAGVLVDRHPGGRGPRAAARAAPTSPVTSRTRSSSRG